MDFRIYFCRDRQTTPDASALFFVQRCLSTMRLHVLKVSHTKYMAGTMVYKHCTSFQSQGLWRGLGGAGMFHSKTKGILQHPPASKFLLVSTHSKQERPITGGYVFTKTYVTKKLRTVRMRRLVLPLSPHIYKTQNKV